jgi:hypothetical protein
MDVHPVPWEIVPKFPTKHFFFATASFHVSFFKWQNTKHIDGCIDKCIASFLLSKPLPKSLLVPPIPMRVA